MEVVDSSKIHIFINQFRWVITLVSEPASMAEGAGTRYSQLAESLAAIKQNQEQTRQNHQALQQLVQGLTQKLNVVASHVEALVQSRATQN